jgi:adenine-specific DNA-methyltransferase
VTTALLASSDQDDEADTPGYLTRQLITCLGNKRALLPEIDAAVRKVQRRLGRTRLRLLDGFSGSGSVSRLFKRHASYLAVNDLEDYAAVAARCYLRNRSTLDARALARVIEALNAEVEHAHLPRGFIEELYAPRNESHITASDRVFYTRANAQRLDAYRRLIAEVPADLQDLCLGPLLSEASIHANTAGVFKGFYKDRGTRIGRYGGSHGDALERIRGRIVLDVPPLSRFECDVEILQDDANAAVTRVRDLDLAYFDPPYNQHPYGSNYFMLNLLVHYERPERLSRVSGIPIGWRRSHYNVRARSLALLTDLFEKTDARYLLVSFNDEGFVAPDRMRTMLAAMGTVEEVALRYNAFRGSRNLRGRPTHVTEHLFLVERR